MSVLLRVCSKWLPYLDVSDFVIGHWAGGAQRPSSDRAMGLTSDKQ